MPEENERGVVFTPELEEEGRIDEFPTESEFDIEEMTENDIDEPNYNSSLNPIPEEAKELTDEQKHEIFIEQLKQSKIKFHPIKHPFKNGMLLTNITVNQFSADYRKKRQRKNKMAKASRRANRK
jgi:hypothetical protein